MQTQAGHPERRETERLLLTIPVRVNAYGGSIGSFTEDTRTVEINRTGARIRLRHAVSQDDTLRIVNLENLREADFRVTGPARAEAGGITEWGMECLEVERNIWGIDFAPPLQIPDSQAQALLECGACGKQSLCVLRPEEVQALESTGALQKLCPHCHELSSWKHAEVSRCERDFPATPAVDEALAPTAKPFVNTRAYKRVALKLPAMVWTQKGERELSKTENVCKGGIAIILGIELNEGEIVRINCPYTEGGQNLDQKAEVRYRKTFYIGQRWLYGMRFVT